MIPSCYYMTVYEDVDGPYDAQREAPLHMSNRM